MCPNHTPELKNHSSGVYGCLLHLRITVITEPIYCEVHACCGFALRSEGPRVHSKYTKSGSCTNAGVQIKAFYKLLGATATSAVVVGLSFSSERGQAMGCCGYRHKSIHTYKLHCFSCKKWIDCVWAGPNFRSPL